jgi:hypothetical protein
MVHRKVYIGDLPRWLAGPGSYTNNSVQHAQDEGKCLLYTEGSVSQIFLGD